MLTENREQVLLDIFKEGLLASSDQQADLRLGNRQSYIGASDLGKYADCPRAAVASKLYPQSNDLGSLLTLQRGHWFETGVGQSLMALGLNAIPQLEISVIYQNIPIKAHLDFTLVWNEPCQAVRILEIKSAERLPETLYAAYEWQIHGQIGLLYRYWNEPVFSLRDSSGAILCANLRFPELCGKMLGLQFPDSPEEISVEAWLLCLSMKEAKCFGPYLFSDSLLTGLLAKSQLFWNDLQAAQANPLHLNEIAYAKGFYPLCAYCDNSSDCPKFASNDYQPEWEQTIARLETLKSERSKFDAEIKDIETALKEVGGKEWINTGSHRFKTTTSTRRTLSRDLLYNELEAIFTEHHLADFDIHALLSRCEQESAPYSRLTINKIR